MSPLKVFRHLRREQKTLDKEVKEDQKRIEKEHKQQLKDFKKAKAKFEASH